ncbi:MAG: flagellar basal body L-ring protein FlgH [Deltaproteobacteria bacterium]|nr:flagellar basal body L-ring protein FlgH [Deltaproteobacteria bacterium]
MKNLLLILSILFLIMACEPRHIMPYTPRHRTYTPDEYAASKTPEQTGSLWSESSPSLFEDLRASRVGDILTVIIDEKSKGDSGAKTSLDKESNMELGMSNMFGLMSALAASHPDIKPEALISLMSKSDFAGDGQTSRSGKLEGRIAVRVKQVMPNGDLFLEGDKVILLNEEEIHFYVSGVIRSVDVSPDNSVSSSLIADAQVEFSGRGVVADQQKPGWLKRIVDKFSPM